MNDERQYTLAELGTLTDLPPRTVRYYIQIGLVGPPEGRGKGARYGTRHLEQLLTIRKWQTAGLSLERIRELLGEADGGPPLPPPRPRGPGTVEVWSHLVLADGIELLVEPSRAALTPEALRSLARDVTALAERVRRQPTSE